MEKAGRIALIAFENEIAWGLRSIAEFLRCNGFVVSLYFLEKYRNIPHGVPEATLERFVDDFAPSDRDLIGVSFMSPYLSCAQQLALKIRPSGARIVVGGIHPTIAPGDCTFADYVIRGAGEYAMLQLAKAISGKNLPRTGVFRNGDEVWFNEDVTTLPYPRYGQVTDNVITSGKLVRTTQVPRRLGLVTRYQTFTSFGCPYKCSYCVNPILQQLADRRGKNFVRRRDPDAVMAELRGVKDKIDAVSFEDEDFLIDTERVVAFLERYKKEINLPFSCLVTPSTLRKNNLELVAQKLREANCISITVGLQSASPRTAVVFQRNFDLEWLQEIARVFARHHIVAVYDLILDNPFEDDEDISQTVDAFLSLPHPLEAKIFHLTFFPGYVITQKARDQGLLSDTSQDTVSRKRGPRTEELVLGLCQVPLVPRRLLKRLYRKRSAAWSRFLIASMGRFILPLWMSRWASMGRVALMHPGFAFSLLKRRARVWITHAQA